jgi:hypothetical protein
VEIYAPFLWPLALPAAVAVLIAMLLRKSPRALDGEQHARRSDIRPVLWVWLLVTFYLVCVGVGRLAYHLMPLLPPLGLLLLSPLGRIAAAYGLGRAVVRHPSAGGLLVLTIGAAFHVALTGWSDARQCAARRPAHAGWLPVSPPQYMQQAAEIHRWCSPGESVYVWGWSPGTYRFAYRNNACRFATLEKMGHLGDGALFIIDEVMHKLRRVPPAVLAISPNDLHVIRTELNHPLHSWINERYAAGDEIGGMTFLHGR